MISLEILLPLIRQCVFMQRLHSLLKTFNLTRHIWVMNSRLLPSAALSRGSEDFFPRIRQRNVVLSSRTFVSSLQRKDMLEAFACKLQTLFFWSSQPTNEQNVHRREHAFGTGPTCLTCRKPVPSSWPLCFQLFFRVFIREFWFFLF